MAENEFEADSHHDSSEVLWFKLRFPRLLFIRRLINQTGLEINYAKVRLKLFKIILIESKNDERQISIKVGFPSSHDPL